MNIRFCTLRGALLRSVHVSIPLFFSVHLLCSQDLPYLRDVIVRASVEYDHKSKIFLFTYGVTNGRSSAGKIDALDIDISRDSLCAAFDTAGLKFARPFIKGSFERNYPKLSNRIVPVGFPNLPRYWIGSLTEAATASFHGQYIEIGENLAGLTMSSRGLPGIKRFIAEPHDISDLYPSIDEVDNPDSLIAKIKADREAVKFRGVTVGPIAPPLNFIAATWLDTLLSYTRQSAELGWLAPSAGPAKRRDDDCDDDERPDNGITKNIEQRLQKAKRELLKRDSVQARKELEKLVQKVERIWKRSQDEEQRRGSKGRWGEKGERSFMTSEAYALLKYNTEYLIERLPEKSKRDREEKEKKPGKH